MAPEDCLIMYHLIINESVLCREMAEGLLLTLWKQKIMHFSHVWKRVCSLLSHICISSRILSWKSKKKKISNPYQLHLKCWEQLKCSCPPFPPPPTPSLSVVGILVLRSQVINHCRLFSCQYKQKAPWLNNGVFIKSLFFPNPPPFRFKSGANIVHIDYCLLFYPAED